MSEAAVVELGEQVQQVRAAATAGDPDDARAGLAAIDSAVERLQGSGEISRDDAHRIIAATADVNRRLGLLTTSTSEPATTLVPTTAPVRTVPPVAPPGQSPADDEEDEEDEEKDDEEKDDEKKDDEEKDDDLPKDPKDRVGRGQGRG